MVERATVQKRSAAPPNLAAMDKRPAKVRAEEFLPAYRHAMSAFDEAHATLKAHLGAESLPTSEEISVEENTRAAVVVFRRRLWAAYRDRARV
jgi:hypothetical protein